MRTRAECAAILDPRIPTVQELWGPPICRRFPLNRVPLSATGLGASVAALCALIGSVTECANRLQVLYHEPDADEALFAGTLDEVRPLLSQVPLGPLTLSPLPLGPFPFTTLESTGRGKYVHASASSSGLHADAPDDDGRVEPRACSAMLL